MAVVNISGLSDGRFISISMRPAGSLPALRVQDEPRVGRVDLLEWAMGRGLRALPELFAAGDAGFSAIGPAYARGGLADVGDVPWIEALASAGISGRDEGALGARAERAFTVDHRGVALPRPRNPFVTAVEAPVLHVLRRPAPAPLGGLGQAWLLFAIVSPTVRSHLAVLARLAWLVADEAFFDLFRGPETDERIALALEEVPTS